MGFEMTSLLRVVDSEESLIGKQQSNLWGVSGWLLMGVEARSGGCGGRGGGGGGEGIERNGRRGL